MSDAEFDSVLGEHIPFSSGVFRECFVRNFGLCQDVRLDDFGVVTFDKVSHVQEFACAVVIAGLALVMDENRMRKCKAFMPSDVDHEAHGRAHPHVVGVDGSLGSQNCVDQGEAFVNVAAIGIKIKLNRSAFLDGATLVVTVILKNVMDDIARNQVNGVLGVDLSFRFDVDVKPETARCDVFLENVFVGGERDLRWVR